MTAFEVSLRFEPDPGLRKGSVDAVASVFVFHDERERGGASRPYQLVLWNRKGARR